MENSEVRKRGVCDFNLKAPIKKSSKIGKLQVIYMNEVIKEINILNENDIPKVIIQKNTFFC